MRLVARIDGELVPLDVERAGAGYRVCVGDRCIIADMASPNPYLRSLRLEDGTQFLIVHHSDGPRHELSFATTNVRLEIHDPLVMRRKDRREDLAGEVNVVSAVMPGRVVRVLVAEGDAVVKGQGLLVIEAMKMENEITSPRQGTVASVLVGEGQTVEGGAELVRIE